MNKQWLYNIKPLPKQFNPAMLMLMQQGQDGWELVCITRLPDPKQFFDGEPVTSEHFAFFKKPSTK